MTKKKFTRFFMIGMLVSSSVVFGVGEKNLHTKYTNSLVPVEKNFEAVKFVWKFGSELLTDKNINQQNEQFTAQNSTISTGIGAAIFGMLGIIFKRTWLHYVPECDFTEHVLKEKDDNQNNDYENN